ncbi:unnamed protein product [Notodromas monacha]|uniref:NADH dehydrogenase [ubiquinone] 1 alpha subcomplex subunit 12 n=1 Tax=Notodromas monacha TaxID=399045 RepID=A0A7R9BLI7_9CRUS|nr:unnamed protein product [Notodromas monacha]CAG0916220.1 unnamed protein product [Notodromas monacha]
MVLLRISVCEIFFCVDEMALAKYLGVDKLRFFLDTIKQKGGVKASLYNMYREGDLKLGKLVGVDEFGNKYFENPYYFFGRNRWVVYPPRVGTDFDASMITPKWYGWLHHKTDLPPTVEKRKDYEWINKAPACNMTGTPEAYMPYSTTPPKVVAWKPSKKA